MPAAAIVIAPALAQQAVDLGDVFLAIGGLVGLVLVGSGVLIWLRRRGGKDDASGDPYAGLQAGRLTPEELASLRSAVARRQSDGGLGPRKPLPRLKPDGTLLAEPGYDLAGDPLPDPEDADPGDPR